MVEIYTRGILEGWETTWQREKLLYEMETTILESGKKAVRMVKEPCTTETETLSMKEGGRMI